MSAPSIPQAGHPGSVRRDRDERIDALVARARAQADSAQADSLERCVRELLRQHDDDDVAAASPDDLLGAVLSLWQHGARRAPGAPKVRVLNPSVSDSGWASRHTVIEVVNDDMPFLVDSTAMAINSQGLTLHLIAHPVFAVERQADDGLLALRTPHEAPGAARESWMHIEVDRIVDPQRRAALVAALEHTLAEVRAAVTDWPAMRARLEQAAGELQAAQAALPAGATDESVAFLSWLADDHFTLLGYRCHDLIAGADGADGLRLVSGSGLGVLRETEAEQLSASFAVLPPKSREMARSPLPLLLVTKANTRATVHRPGYTDYIGVKRYDARGAVIGEHRFIGLFTSSAYSTRVAETPLLRGKMRSLAARAGFASGGHLEKALHHLVETYPRDELYQLTDDALYENAMGILALGERKRLRLLTWADPFDRFVSCLVYVPRDAYSTDLRMKLQAILLNAFAGTRAEYDVQLGDATLARIHFTVRTVPGQVPPWERKAIEARLAAAARRWDDELSDALVEAEGEARGLELLERFGRAFPLAYRERVAARAAVADVRKLAALTPEEPVAVALVRPLGAPPDTLGFR
ncbi:MAG: NAD-glutamate dehydrogenase, partial [Aquabacterium sp.]|nr:NAD-glutamate dehydrogenase [Aquabacterium sp.]